MASKLRATFVLVSVALASAAGVVAACSDSSSGGGAKEDASVGGDANGTDSAVPTSDAAREASSDGGADAPSDAPAKKDANGPGEAGADCSFNKDCNAALRCECSEQTGCACKPGVRGTGQIGIDKCDSGDQCESAVCVEGPGSGTFYCSDECMTGADCKGQLPVCKTIAFVGRICIRDGG